MVPHLQRSDRNQFLIEKDPRSLILLGDPSWRLLVARRKSLRSQLYRAARDVGNIEAAEKGPASYGKRVVRRKVYAKTNGLTRKFLRKFGL